MIKENFTATSDFVRLADANLQRFTTDVISSMTGNENFPAPFPKLVDMQTLLDAYSATLTDRASQNQNTAAIKNQKREELIANLKFLASYVSTAAKGDRVIVLSSGFTPKKQRKAAGELPPPQNPRTKYGVQSGSINVTCNRVTNAYSYEAQSKSEDGEWVLAPSSTRANVLIAGLTAGKKYDFQIRAVGAAGASAWSTVIGVMVI